MRGPLCIFILVFPGLSSFAQKKPRVFEKMGMKDFQEKLVYIPTKTFTSLRHSGSDSVSFYQPRSATVPGFYISETEVTNREYRQFVQYVRDSIAHTLLGHFVAGTNKLDWKQPIGWEDKKIEPMMISPELRYNGRKEIDPAGIQYKIEWPGGSETISIYPDTLVWIQDFSYSYNEPMVKRYFRDAEFDDHPVVGISQKQARAFCQWKTVQLNQAIKPGNAAKIIIQLPSNAQWESAAFETRDTTIQHRKNRNYLYNFGNILDGNRILVKSYRDDGFFYTGRVKSYPPGDYDLFDMKGNVSEWTATPMEEVMRTEVKETKKQTMFVVKGGGWNSTPFYLQAGVCQFFAAGAAHSYIGFRYIVEVSSKP